MKKLLSLFMVVSLLLMGCGGNEEPKKEKPVEKEKEKTKTDLEIVSEVFTLETETGTTGTIMGIAKDGDTVKFKMYVEISGEEAQMAEALGISNGDLIYSVDGNDSETYLVDLNMVFVTASNADAETMKKNMDDYLSGKNITLDQLTKAMEEKFSK